MGATCVDHLERCTEEDIQVLSDCGTVATLLPGAQLYLKDTPPPVHLLRTAGVPMAVATDLNPGSSPIHDIWTCATLACITQGLTIPEAALGITRHAGQALGFNHLGWLGNGSSADCILLRPLQENLPLSIPSFSTWGLKSQWWPKMANYIFGGQSTTRMAPVMLGWGFRLILFCGLLWGHLLASQKTLLWVIHNHKVSNPLLKQPYRCLRMILLEVYLLIPLQTSILMFLDRPMKQGIFFPSNKMNFDEFNQSTKKPSSCFKLWTNHEKS